MIYYSNETLYTDPRSDTLRPEFCSVSEEGKTYTNSNLTALGDVIASKSNLYTPIIAVYMRPRDAWAFACVIVIIVIALCACNYIHCGC